MKTTKPNTQTTEQLQKKCDLLTEIETPIVTAPMPAPVYPGSLASPSSMAYVMSQKYVDGMPLHRQEKHMERLGFTLSRQTMANWMIYGTDRWLSLIYDEMVDSFIF